MKFHFFDSKQLSRLVVACFIVALSCVYCYSPFSIVFDSRLQRNAWLTYWWIGGLNATFHSCAPFCAAMLVVLHRRTTLVML